MFDIGMGELALIGLLALIVLGPKRLPEVARTAGVWVGRVRRFVASVKEDFEQELRTEELTELRKLQQELSDTRDLIQKSSTDALEGLQRDLEPATPVEPADKQPRLKSTTGKRLKSTTGKRPATRTAKTKKSVTRPARTKKPVTRKKHGGARKSRSR
jgi:sec-independent protein translocase protein TatB